MKKALYLILFAAALLTGTTGAHAQTSLKDLVSKVVSAVTNKTDSIMMEGTWSYSSCAIDFESDSFLQKAGGKVAASAAEKKLNEELEKAGISEGTLSFTFSADSTFTTKVSSKKLSGTYSYNSDDKKVTLKIAKILTLNATMNYSASSMDLLFDADKILTLVSTITGLTNSNILSAVSSIASSYDGMMVGFTLKKED
ncbi:MAG: DUF4923 family protein [Prevotellaceae bacterium]|nr:DUF4923 family protein [Prevotellaceae bacterium]